MALETDWEDLGGWVCMNCFQAENGNRGQLSFQRTMCHGIRSFIAMMTSHAEQRPRKHMP